MTLVCTGRELCFSDITSCQLIHRWTAFLKCMVSLVSRPVLLPIKPGNDAKFTVQQPCTFSLRCLVCALVHTPIIDSEASSCLRKRVGLGYRVICFTGQDTISPGQDTMSPDQDTMCMSCDMVSWQGNIVSWIGDMLSWPGDIVS